MVVRVAQAVPTDAVICATESGYLFRLVHEHLEGPRLIAATPNGDTHDALVREGFVAVRLPVRLAHKLNQAQHALSVALNAGKVSAGEVVVCVVGHNLSHQGGDLILATDVEAETADVQLSDLVRLTDGIRGNILEAALQVGAEIGKAARRGRPRGALIVLGDSEKVLQGAKQLILNPFHGHDDANRMLTNTSVHGMMLELAKLDGAFVVRGDGYIRTAGAFLSTADAEVEIPQGLGTRHFSAAAVTARTDSTAVVVSSTDGHIRVFSGGVLVLEMDPDVPLVLRP